jgi:hypothetical protein
MRRLDMLKAREILRLKHEAGLSLREIGKSCNCGKTTVSEILERAEKVGITWPIELSDKQLVSLLYPPADDRSLPPEPDMEYIFYEMKKKGVTLMLLWEECKEKHPDGIMYTQFCERYRNFKKDNNITMHIEHKAGEEVQVDWAGQTLSYVEPESVKREGRISLCRSTTGQFLSLRLCLQRYQAGKLDRCPHTGLRIFRRGPEDNHTG